jgi:hypothetical protein
MLRALSGRALSSCGKVPPEGRAFGYAKCSGGAPQPVGLCRVMPRLFIKGVLSETVHWGNIQRLEIVRRCTLTDGEA